MLEKAFNLGRMQIHRDEMIDTYGLRDERYHARHNRFSATMAFIRARIPKIRNDCDDFLCRSPAAGIRHRQQLDKMVIHRRACRLHYEYFAPAHCLADIDRDFTVGKMLHGARAERYSKLSPDGSRQVYVRRATEESTSVHPSPRNRE